MAFGFLRRVQCHEVYSIIGGYTRGMGVYRELCAMGQKMD
jgi:hypothetical protein